MARIGKWKLVDENDTIIDENGKILYNYKCIICNNEKYMSKASSKGTTCKICLQDYYENAFIGKVYGRLTILKYSHMRGRKHYLYICKCSCNNEIVDHPIDIHAMSCGNTNSCGCIQREVASKTHKIEYKSPKLNVISFGKERI